MEAVLPREGQREKLSCRHRGPPRAGPLPQKPKLGAGLPGGGAAGREGDAPLEDWLLGELTEKERVIVWLRCVRRMSYAEIARALRLPYEQTRKCGYRGLQKLRRRLERLAKE